MSKDYPYLLAGLPELTLDGEVKSFSFDELTKHIRENFDAADQRLLRLLLLGLKEKSQTAAFYSEAAKCRNKFVRNYFTFDLDSRNILAGAAAKKMDLKAEPYLVGQNTVTEAILHSKANDFGLSAELDFMPALYSAIETENLLEREQKLDKLRWDKADELTVFNYLDIDKILAFVLKASIVNRWQKLDKKAGTEFFERLVNDVKGSRNLSPSPGLSPKERGDTTEKYE